MQQDAEIEYSVDMSSAATPYGSGLIHIGDCPNICKPYTYLFSISSKTALNGDNCVSDWIASI
jgi:hypothetical protein